MSSVYLSDALQLNAGCFSVGAPSLGPTHVGSLLAPELLSLIVRAIACSVHFAASTAVCEIPCVIAAWSVTILFTSC